MTQVTWTFTNDSGEKELTEPTQMRLRSLHSLQHSRVNFVNKTNSVVRAMWINFDGDEVSLRLTVVYVAVRPLPRQRQPVEQLVHPAI